MDIANTIKTKRKEKGLTQDAMAEALGVTKATVSKWETGQSCPDVGMLPVIADYFGISTDALLGRGKERRTIGDKIEYYDGAIYREDFCGSDEFFDTLEIKKVTFDKCGFDDGTFRYLTTIIYKSYDPDYLTKLQSAMSFELRPYIDNIEKHTDGTVYHVWVCKDEMFRFKPGDNEAIKRAYKRLTEKGLLTEDDLY